MANNGAGRRFFGSILLAASLGVSPSLSLAFDESPVGARPAALGGAFTGLADDVHSLYYNPAGLGTLYRPEVTAYYARLYPGLSDQTHTAQTFIGAALPLPADRRWGGLGIGYQEFRVDSLFKERTTTLAYGKSLMEKRMSLGVGLKMLDRSYGENADTANAFSGANPGNRTGAQDPVFLNGHSKTALGVDLGALYTILPDIRLGLSLLNANRPDLGLVSDDRLPMITRLGAVYDKKLLKVTADLTHRTFLTGQADTRLQLGGERLWAFKRYGMLAVRGGAGVGGRDYRQVNVGAGYEVNGVVLDYVFTLPLGAADETGNLHNISLSYKFGRAPAEDELYEMMREEREATARAEAALKTAEAESAFIRAERNKLLNQYATDVERLKAELAAAKKAGAKPAAAVPVPTRVLSAAERERLARDKAYREYSAAYEAAMRGYGAQVSRGESLAGRIELLNGILGKYSKTGVDVSRAARELERVKSDLAQVSTDYRITLDFYKKTVAQGGDVTERISLLERMIKRYSRSGIDLSEVKNELAKLKNP